MSFHSLLLTVAIIMAIWGLLGLGLNLNYGDTGLLNFAHVGFFGIGAYTSAILTVPPPTGQLADRVVGFDMPIVVGILAGTVVAALAGLLFALPSAQLDGDYFAIVTLSLAEISRFILTNEKWLTAGVKGLNNIPRPLSGQVQAAGVDYNLFYLPLIIAVMIVSLLVLKRLTESPFGRILHAVREDEQVPKALGKNTYRAKLKSFGIAAGLAGLAGGLWAHWSYALTPFQFNPNITFLIWTGIILGGIGNHYGALLGTFIIVFLREATRLLPDLPFGLSDDVQFLRLILIGALLIAVLYFRPHGIMGDKERLSAGTTGGGE
jgi:branched-chain amino acid transport system permease protein